MAAEDKFESVLSTRYCKNSPLVKILSETNKATLWRQLWIWLAESEKELGLKQVTQEAIDEMKAQRDHFDWPFIRAEERKLKHDVMAHNHAFGKICPTAAGIIHLGATSCFVQDNADLIAYRESIDHILKRFATVIDRLAVFSLNNKEVVTVGRTHYQTASLVTVGKRGVLWAQELLMAFQSLAEFRDKMRFRGIKGATGTQDSFLTLFAGDESKVEDLDELVTKKTGFARRFLISGQTYSRQQDSQLVFSLSLLGAAAKKVCTDIRILQAFGELLEPFEKDQIGSSAMPYKKNPMKSERCCSLARKLINAPQEALTILADQGLERTLDDSAGRRILIPDVLLTSEALLTTLQNIFEGLTVQTDNVKKIVDDEIAFLGLEKAMMMLTEEGVDRQQAHAVIRKTALDAKQLQATQKVDIRQTLADPFFDSVRERIVGLVNNPINFTGRCVSQTENFIAKELKPAISKYLDQSAGNVHLDSCYCEENVYKLIERVGKCEGLYAIFISNDCQMVPLWMQKSADDPLGFVVWDYHVIAIQKEKKGSKVYDLDSRLDWGVSFETYWKETMRWNDTYSSRFRRKFRVISSPAYLTLLSSDRSHMKSPDGNFLKPPPEWPVINPQLPSNLMQLIKFSEHFDDTQVMNEHEIFGFFST
ncbi:unnamed protein product [Caenorhabditis sp. 36 PRJEB53466]|nr:unnamed protein product [Caenorhabditis sp. 36 PRJEB53466]